MIIYVISYKMVCIEEDKKRKKRKIGIKQERKRKFYFKQY